MIFKGVLKSWNVPDLKLWEKEAFPYIRIFTLKKSFLPPRHKRHRNPLYIYTHYKFDRCHPCNKQDPSFKLSPNISFKCSRTLKPRVVSWNPLRLEKEGDIRRTKWWSHLEISKWNFSFGLRYGHWTGSDHCLGLKGLLF